MTGRTSIESLAPFQVVLDQGKLFSLSNRRLAAVKMFQALRQHTILKVPCHLYHVGDAQIASKYAAGRLTLPSDPDEYVPSRMKSSGVDALPLQHSHALQVARLPWHHRDPFDRLLIAQAQVEALPILSADRALAAYDVQLYWAD